MTVPLFDRVYQLINKIYASLKSLNVAKKRKKKNIKKAISKVKVRMPRKASQGICNTLPKQNKKRQFVPMLEKRKGEKKKEYTQELNRTEQN